MIISITGGEDMRLMEIDEAAMRIKAEVDPDATIIWGSAIDPAFEGRIRVSIVATGIDAHPGSPEAPALAALAPQRHPDAEAALAAAEDDLPLEVRIAAPWEEGCAASDAVVLPRPLSEAELGLREAASTGAAIPFGRTPEPAEEELILVRPAAATALSDRTVDDHDPFARAVTASPSRPSLLQRLSTLARGDGGRPRPGVH